MTEKKTITNKKVLIVEDEPNVVAYLETLLQDNGYDTVSALTGAEALEKVRGEKPDLICLDINIPEPTGIRFYRMIKEDPGLAAIPVVVVTAITGKGGDPEPFRRFLNTRRQVPPPEGFIPKPIDRQRFLDTLARILS